MFELVQQNPTTMGYLLMIVRICSVDHGQLVNHNFKVKDPNATKNWDDSNGDITEIMLRYCHLIFRINYQLLVVWEKRKKNSEWIRILMKILKRLMQEKKKKEMEKGKRKILLTKCKKPIDKITR